MNKFVKNLAEKSKSSKDKENNMANTTFKVIHSVGIKSNRKIERAESTSKSKPALRVANPADLGYNPKQCELLESILKEL